MRNYQIQCELLGHDGAVRAVGVVGDVLLTGSMDSVLRRWVRDPSIQNGPTQYYAIEDMTIYVHQHWITAILHVSDNIEKFRDGFVTGSMDKHIRVFNAKGDIVSQMEGHDGGVISLAWLHRSNGNAEKFLLSGSWDGTCRIWDLLAEKIIFELPNHENGVSVLGLDNGVIVTASTGKQVGNEVVDFQLRFWNGNDNNFPMIKTVKDHKGPIRQLIHVPDVGFASCSNDGSVKIRTLNGECITTMSHPLNAEGKPGFVLGICMLGTDRIVSVSEDSTAKIWRLDGTLLQTINHPAGLWCVASMANGDFIIGCDDKVARIFTENESTVVPEAQSSFEKAIHEAELLRQRSSGVDLASLPDYANRGQIVGKADGQIQMFRYGDKAWACQWSAPSRTWCDIGEVTGTGNGGIVDGNAYDMVIPVEIEQPGTGEVLKLEIGYNFGENPFDVAQAFINKNRLNQYYLKEIADYISQRSKNYNPPILESSDTKATSDEKYSQNFQYFPAACYNTFESLKVNKLMSTLRQFNQEMSQDIKVSEADLDLLDLTIKIIQDSAFYHASSFSENQLTVLRNIIYQWPPTHVYPALDLARLVLIHPQGFKLVNESVFFEKILACGLTTEYQQVPPATRFLSLRILANAFIHEISRAMIVQKRDLIIGQLEHFIRFGHKLIALSYATVLLNFSRLTAEAANAITLDDSIRLVQIAVKSLENSVEEIGEDTVLRILICIGTLLLREPSLTTNEKLQLSFAVLKEFMTAILGSKVNGTAITACIAELQQIVFA